jgi:hypothetical protein
MVANKDYQKLPDDPSGFKTRKEFYPFYLGEHANQTCRRLHVLSTTGVVVISLYSAIFDLKSIWLAPLVGYGGAWIGHFFFEKNKPATFKYPLYSLISDFQLWYEVVTGLRAF